MSRIGKKPVKIENGVTVKVNGNVVSVTGPKGVLNFSFKPDVRIKVEGDEVILDVVSETKESSAMFGMTRAIINNMVKGVSQGFEKKLELVGVGYRAKMANPKTISLTLGFSHPVEFPLPEGVTAEIADQFITVKGVDRQQVGQVAANLRKLRKPEPYKGKGIKYTTEYVRRKQGKSGKV